MRSAALLVPPRLRAAAVLAAEERARVPLPSTAFAPNGSMPSGKTADGAGVAPPLVWRR